MNTKKTFITDMDGVLVHGQKAIPGADKFIHRLIDNGHKYLVLTNNSRYTPTDFQHRLQSININVDVDHLFSSAMATANFVDSQKPNGSAYVLGDTGLYQALADAGYTLTEYSPDYVILGETESYPYDKLLRAIHLIVEGTPFIATNPDTSGPGDRGLVPGCGAVAAMIEKATGFGPYYVGKPNPLMMRSALRYLDEHSENAIMIGDRMDTDIKAGLESGMETILVLTGVTSRDMLSRFPYRPNYIVDSIADINPEDYV